MTDGTQIFSPAARNIQLAEEQDCPARETVTGREAGAAWQPALPRQHKRTGK